METLFQDTEVMVETAVGSLRTTFLGRTATAIDRAVKVGADTAFKAVVGASLEGRGYQLHGLNCAPQEHLGLSRGQREVRFCTYGAEAEPFLREARNIAAMILADGASPSDGLTLGKGECLMRVVIPEELATAEHTESFTGKGKGSSGMSCCMGCVGGKDLLVFDMRVSEQTLASVTNITDKCFATKRNPPAYYLTQAIGSVNAKLRKSKAGEISSGHRHYLHFADSAAENQYVNSVKLLLLAQYLNRAQNAAHTSAHIACIDNQYADLVETEEPSIWFPPAETKNPATEQLEKAVASLHKMQGGTTNLIPCVPATSFTGTPYEDMKVSVTDEQHEALLKQSLAGEGGPTQHAFYCGPNITGAQPPLDTKHPDTWASAYTRHFCRVEKDIPLPSGGVFHVVVDKAENQSKMLSGNERRVWSDMVEQHAELFRTWLENHPPACPEGKPNSISREEYEEIKGEVAWDEAWGARKIIRSSLFLKAGEGSERGRFITLPGADAKDAKRHQCAASHITQIIEKFHLDQFGFRNFKGCTVTGRAKKVARFVAASGDESVTIGYDKSSNDRTWNHRKWEQYENYSMAMATVLADAYFDDDVKSLLEADSHNARRIEWRGIYLTVAAEIQYWYLMSAVAPTSLCNRMGGDVSVGAAIRQIAGPDAYATWLGWCSGVTAQSWDEAPVALFPHLKDGILVKENPTVGYAHLNEGDDTAVRIIRRKGETNSAAVTRFTVGINSATGEAWEPAFVNEEHLDKHGGPRSCVEITSLIVAQSCDQETDEIVHAFVPKPIRRLDKLAWSLSAALKVVETPAGKVGVLDHNYYRLNATRCLSMCLEMGQSLFTRWVMLRTAEFHLQELRKLPRVDKMDVPLYGDRTMEARNVPEATGFIGDSIEKAFERISAFIGRVSVDDDTCLEANANAWCLACPALAADGKALRRTLLDLDAVASAVAVTQEHIHDPVSYLSLFDLGPLEQCFKTTCQRLERATAERDPVPLALLMEGLKASVSAKGQRVAQAQSQPWATKRSYDGATTGALGRSGKGAQATRPPRLD